MALDPLARAVAPETHGAVLLGTELPSVPDLLEQEGLSAAADPEAGAWLRSWELGEVDGAELRSQVYPGVAARLSPSLGPEGVLELLDKVESGLRAADQASLLLGAQGVRAGLARAHDLAASSRETLNGGDLEGALSLGLQAADAIRAVGPREVAVALLDQASEALGRIPDPSTYSQEELTRIRRLTFGASEALEKGDYPLAIRRAYYACQLLGAKED